MSYTEERDRFIARMTTEGLGIGEIRGLLRAATTLQRYAELACSSEAADRDRVECPASTEVVRQYGSAARPPMRTVIGKRKPDGPCLCDDYPAGSHAAGKHSTVPRIAVQGDRLKRRIAGSLPAGWGLDKQGDPRGYVLRVIPPSYQERNQGRDRFNLDTIGVPSGPSRLRF